MKIKTNIPELTFKDQGIYRIALPNTAKSYERYIKIAGLDEYFKSFKSDDAPYWISNLGIISTDNTYIIPKNHFKLIIRIASYGEITDVGYKRVIAWQYANMPQIIPIFEVEDEW